MDKENAVYTPSGVLFSLKKEGNSVTCDHVDEPGGHIMLSEISQSQKDKHRMIPLIGGI